MKKGLFFIFLSCCFGPISNAQVIHSINFGPDIGVGANFGKSANASFGGSLEYTAKFSPVVSARFATGYNKFNAKSGSGFISFLPIRAGIQTFIFEQSIFIYGEGGIVEFKGGTGTNTNGPSFGLGGGYRQPLDKGQYIQFSAYFNFFRLKVDVTREELNYTWFNFRGAYGFSWGRKKTSK